jgi:glycosyltransferase involved in cell wall biosynthesis
MTLADGPLRQRTVALLPWGDRFEDFYDKIGVSFEIFRTQVASGWLFHYIEALQSAGVRTVLYFASDTVDAPLRFTHGPTGAVGWLLPTPRLHRKVRGVARRFMPRSEMLPALASYVATPLHALRRTLRDEGCDAILCQEYEGARFELCALLGRSMGLPVFATYQGAEPGPWLERPIRRLAVRNSTGLIIAASEEAGRVRRTYRIPAHRIANIPNPFDVQTWQPIDRRRAREELGIAQDARVVEWHGHAQIWRKGLDVLLDAWELVCEARPDANLLLLLIGTGRNTVELRDRVKSDQRIRWVDRYIHDRHELWSYICAADVYTLPSRHEGFAVAPVEAMAAGLPVVAADVPGVADLLRGGEDAGGIIVPREDPAALAAALGRLVDDDDLAHRLGARARRHAERDYSLEVVGNELRRFMFDEGPSADRP